MGNSASVWLVIVLAVLAANTPFVNERCFAVISLKWFAVAKPLWARLLELIVLYFCLGFIAHALESGAGNPFPQGWEFYAINACLFLVLAFPGFVYRYLKRKHD